MPDLHHCPVPATNPEFVVQSFVDILYDYRSFLGGGPIGSPPISMEGDVCIIGAGPSGLCAGYELLRVGLVPTILEANDRVGGRNWSRPFTNHDGRPVSAFAEMGAMRFPASSHLLWHYVTNTFGLGAMDDFPDPGTVETMLWVQGKKIPWPAGNHDTPPPPFDKIARDWDNFITNLTSRLMTAWAASDLAGIVSAWQRLIDQYSHVSFYEALVQGIPQWDEDDLYLFGALGIGSGGFGCFYSIGFLEILRIVVNQLEVDQRGIVEGISALDEGFYRHNVSLAGSLASLESLNAVKFNARVVSISRDSNDGRYHVTWETGGKTTTESFHTVIVATTTQSMQMMGLGIGDVPDETLLADPAENAGIRGLHMTKSSKLFIRTATKFWKHANLPQNIQTDQLPRGVYCLDYPQTDNGVVLVSYTWEEDSQKLQALDAANRFRILRNQLAVAFPEFATALDPVNGEILSIDWQDEPHMHGAFKLNLPGQEANNDALFFQFQRAEFGQPALILAGEGISWSGGWVEGALQTGLQAACAALRSVGGHVRSGSPLEMKRHFTYRRKKGDEYLVGRTHSSFRQSSPQVAR